MFKVFIRSYEDQSYIGRHVKLEDIEPIADRENFGMTFAEVIEFLKNNHREENIMFLKTE